MSTQSSLRDSTVKFNQSPIMVICLMSVLFPIAMTFFLVALSLLDL